MGKSEKGAIWLDRGSRRRRTRSTSSGSTWPTPTSASFLRWFTLLEEPAIKRAGGKVGTGERIAQKMLAQEITTLVHGQDGDATTPGKASEALFSGDIASLPVSLFKQLAIGCAVDHVAGGGVWRERTAGDRSAGEDEGVLVEGRGAAATRRRKASASTASNRAGENPAVTAADFSKARCWCCSVGSGTVFW